MVVLNYMLADDYGELIPQGAANHLAGNDPDAYEDYKQALGTLEQYIQENKPTH